jgi:anti-sigma B factor antagonist
MDQLADQPRARVSVVDVEDRLSVGLAGELDIASLAEVQADLDALLRRPRQPLLLDLADLEFMDSSGVAMLIRLANHFGNVEARRPTAAVRRVFQALGLSGRFGLDGD